MAASKLRAAVVPVYLLACLLLGGSAQGIWGNLVLQLGGLAIIAWAAIDRGMGPLPPRAQFLLLLVIAAIVIVMLQQVPLPAALPGRQRILDGFAILGRSPPPLPVSLTPYEGLSALLSTIPSIAVLCAMVRSQAYRKAWIAAALLAGTVAGVMLGALQVATPETSARWYLYPETNFGVGVGFFANANHMATLLLVAMPFAAAVAAASRRKGPQVHSATLIVVAAMLLVILVGLALNGSLAGYLLAGPVLLASALILLPDTIRGRRWIAVAAVATVAVGLAALATSAIGSGKIGRDASASVQSREEILRTTVTAMNDFMPLGSGLGSFAKVYRLYESPAAVTSEYVIHAHNDYAELALELGVPGIILVLVFLGWWGLAVVRAWTAGGAFARAAAIASATVLVHSLVDFPLRTAAIGAFFAMCLGLLVERPKPSRTVRDLRPARHIVID